MLVKDIMKMGLEAFRDGDGDSVTVVTMRMRDVETGFVPVCDVHGHPLGTVTDFSIAQSR